MPRPGRSSFRVTRENILGLRRDRWFFGALAGGGPLCLCRHTAWGPAPRSEYAGSWTATGSPLSGLGPRDVPRLGVSDEGGPPKAHAAGTSSGPGRNGSPVSGFDVLYLPRLHPQSGLHRIKGKRQTIRRGDTRPKRGSPWGLGQSARGAQHRPSTHRARAPMGRLTRGWSSGPAASASRTRSTLRSRPFPPTTPGFRGCRGPPVVSRAGRREPCSTRGTPAEKYQEHSTRSTSRAEDWGRGGALGGAEGRSWTLRSGHEVRSPVWSPKPPTTQLRFGFWEWDESAPSKKPSTRRLR